MAADAHSASPRLLGRFAERASRAFRWVTRRAAVRRGLQAVLQAMADRGNYHLIRGMADGAVQPDTRRFAEAAPWRITTDFVRDGTLELICRETRDLRFPGDVAELGVCRGDFGWLMSTYLHGRRVHLFDTFEGFEESDMRIDEGRVDTFINFAATDSDRVRARFSDAAVVDLHIGPFPATAAAVADDVRFALVSIDADLYAPVLAGLRWFYERLSPGGYVMVHDYNNAAFAGARVAVREFQQASGATVIPLPDWGGTAVIARPLQ
jgi:O-methyltransferase